MTAWRRVIDSDLYYSFTRSKLTVAAAAIAVIFILASLFAPLVAPHNPFDLATVQTIDGDMPPAWSENGSTKYLLGTDDQGRDILSTILYGSRSSLLVGFLSVLLAMAIGITLGLVAGFSGGLIDAVIMRTADVQLSFPAILVALLIDGIVRAVLGEAAHQQAAIYVLIVSIGLSFWVQYARTVRASVMVEKNKEYVQAARVTGLPSFRIALRHVLPNVMGPVLVIGTINLALAIITEATLSFLGVGLPITEPSLGTLISIGQKYLFAGEWWITVFPGLALAIFVLSINLLGDWLRDALNPRLR
ncbi:MAG: ABC transporter permease [Alphaproteobacteria bacterium]